MVLAWIAGLVALGFVLAVAVSNVGREGPSSSSDTSSAPSTTIPRQPSETALYSGPSVSSREAADLAARAWEIRRYAYLSGDDRLVREISRGRALDIDLGRCSSRCDDPAAWPASHWRVSLDDSSGTTRRVLAEARADRHATSAVRVFVVLERDGLESPWHIVLAGSDELGEDEVMTDAGLAIAPAVEPSVDMHALLPELARWWQTWYDDGRPPTASLVDPHDGSSYLMLHGYEVGGGQRENAARGVVQSIRYRAGTTYLFDGALGGQVVCGYVDFAEATLPLTGESFPVPYTIDAMNTFLAAGDYRRVDTWGARASCVHVVGTRVRVVGDFAVVYRAEGQGV